MNIKTGIIISAFGAGYYAALLVNRKFDMLYLVCLILMLTMTIGLTFVKQKSK